MVSLQYISNNINQQEKEVANHTCKYQKSWQNSKQEKNDSYAS